MKVTQEEYDSVYNEDDFVDDLSYATDLRRKVIILRRALLAVGFNKELLEQLENEKIEVEK